MYQLTATSLATSLIFYYAVYIQARCCKVAEEEHSGRLFNRPRVNNSFGIYQNPNFWFKLEGGSDVKGRF